jgi:hypothetical protein
MSSHREPPKPPHYHNPLPGQCRWCGQLIFKTDGITLNKRANWHPSCVKEYKLLHWPAVTRKAVYRRDKGICKECGHQCSRKGKDVWHLDHKKPLIESNGDLEYWKLPNLQTLCQPCHYKKTGAEATARAEARRLAKLNEDDGESS